MKYTTALAKTPYATYFTPNRLNAKILSAVPRLYIEGPYAAAAKRL